jgi:2-polyprenyl-3-methyl-5-hydroxy-6-metoxy-1,4-benzoquinol methylase
MKEIYNNVYNNFENYDEKYDYKINLVDLQFNNFSKDANILDIGCGKGHYIRHMIDRGYNNILGIEFSTLCSQKYLTDIPHLNVDFLEYCQTIKNNHYDVCLCMDVLEHISYDQVEFMIENISRIGNNSILGIANHSDIFMGEELHIIQENSNWWKTLLSKKFTTVEKIFENKQGTFFLFVCESK